MQQFIYGERQRQEKKEKRDVKLKVPETSSALLTFEDNEPETFLESISACCTVDMAIHGIRVRLESVCRPSILIHLSSAVLHERGEAKRACQALSRSLYVCSANTLGRHGAVRVRAHTYIIYIVYIYNIRMPCCQFCCPRSCLEEEREHARRNTRGVRCCFHL